MRILLHLNLLMAFIACICSLSRLSSERQISENEEKADTLLQKARLCESQNRPEQALICYWDVLDMLRETQCPDTVGFVATVYCRLGNLLSDCGLPEKAVEYHRKSLDTAGQNGSRFLRRVLIPSVIVAGQEEAVTQACGAQQVADDVGRLARRACEPCPSAVNPQGGDGK